MRVLCARRKYVCVQTKQSAELRKRVPRSKWHAVPKWRGAEGIGIVHGMPTNAPSACRRSSPRSAFACVLERTIEGDGHSNSACVRGAVS